MNTETTFRVRIWEPKPTKSRDGRITGYTCRWFLANETDPRTEYFTKKAAATNFTSMLRAAHSRGEAFAFITGLPLSHPDTVKALAPPEVQRLGVVEAATRFVDRKWDNAAAGYRLDIAKVLTSFTVAMLAAEPPAPFAGQLLRMTLQNGQYTLTQRPGMSEKQHSIVAWVSAHTRPLQDLAEPLVFESVFTTVMRKLDGTPRAASTYKRWRTILSTFFKYCMYLEQLAANPLDTKELTDSAFSRPTKNIVPLDKRRLANNALAETLLDSVAANSRSSSVALAMEVMYRVGLRPEEVVALKVEDFTARVGNNGFGELVFSNAEPETDRRFTDSGTRRTRSGLKHRSEAETRRAPVYPSLAGKIAEHITEKKLKPGDYLFTGQRGGPLAYSVLDKALKKARERVLTAEEVASDLAKTLYDWRHLCLTGWLNRGVPPATVALWAGNSVAVLLAYYINAITNEDVLRGLLLGMYDDDTVDSAPPDPYES